MKNFINRTLAATTGILATAVVAMAGPVEQVTLAYERVVVWPEVRIVIDILTMAS